LFENFEKITEEVLKVRKERDKGQFSLFDDWEGQQEKMMFNGIMDKKNQEEEYPPKQLLNFEKEMLGLYISGHPLFEYESTLAKLTPISKLQDIEDKATVTVGGIITNIKNIYTKRDQQMCFVDFEDIENSLEVIVFPTVLEKYRGLVRDDRIIKIKGKLDKKEDQIKLLANELTELIKDDPQNTDPGRQMGGTEKDKVVFAVRKKDIDRELINRFYQILKNNPGECMVEFKIVGGNNHKPEKSYSLPGDFKVDAGKKLFNEIENDFSGKVFRQ
ncbi:MAG: hypothetical protein KAI62_05945, partial [Actinomycetia bacterium]|nr:hypothetical protein [Actinomycetes bacterium]